MNEDLFLEIISLLTAHAKDCRDDAKERGESSAADMWSAVAGHLDNARQRMSG